MGQKYFLRQRYFPLIWSSWMGFLFHVCPTCLLMAHNENQYKADCDWYNPQANSACFRCSAKSLQTSQHITPIKVKRGFFPFFLGFFLYLFLMLQRWHWTCCLMIAIKELPKISNCYVIDSFSDLLSCPVSYMIGNKHFLPFFYWALLSKSWNIPVKWRYINFHVWYIFHEIWNFFQTNANILSIEKTIYYKEKYKKNNFLLSYTLNVFRLL